MRAHAAPADFPIRPTVVAVLVYGFLLSVSGLWMVSTATYGLIGEPPQRLLSTPWFAAVSVADLALLTVLLFDGARSLRSGPAERRGQLTGVVLAVALLALVQLGAWWAHRSLM